MNFVDIAYAAGTAEPTSEVAGQGGGISALGINGTLFIFQLINFAIVAGIIWFLILKPLTKKMGERQRIIEDSLESAKKIEENLRQSEHKFQERVDAAKVEANKIVEKAMAEAESVSATLKEKAKKEIENLVEQAKNNIALERTEMVSVLRKETVGLVVMALERVLGEKMDSAKDKQMIEGLLAQIKTEYEKVRN